MREETQVEKYLLELKSVKIFHWLHEIELKKLLFVSKMLHFDENETVINQDDIGDCIYAVTKGEVEVSIKTRSGRQMVVCTIGQGEIFGEAAIFLSARRTASIDCQKDTTVIQISRQDLIQFIRDHPHAGNKLLMLIVLSLLEKLRHTNQDLVLEKQPQVDFDNAADLIQEFIRGSGPPAGAGN